MNIWRYYYLRFRTPAHAHNVFLVLGMESARDDAGRVLRWDETADKFFDDPPGEYDAEKDEYSVPPAVEVERANVLFAEADLHGFRINHVGLIYKPTERMIRTPEGDVPEMTTNSLHHVNLDVFSDAEDALRERLLPFLVRPEFAKSSSAGALEQTKADSVAAPVSRVKAAEDTTLVQMRAITETPEIVAVMFDRKASAEGKRSDPASVEEGVAPDPDPRPVEEPVEPTEQPAQIRIR